MSNIKEVLKETKRIEIKTRGLVEGLLAGAYHSVFKGRGIEFSEVREYVAGDDIRAIDWKVTARMNFPHVKEFIEERDIPVYVLFDISASQNFGRKKTKRKSSVEIAASLMLAAVRDNDPVSLCLFTDRIEMFIPPRKGKRHALGLILKMLEAEPKGRGTDIKRALSFIARIAKRRSIIFVISDFDADDFGREASILKRRHDLIFISITDESEMEIPDMGYVMLEDEETGEQVIVDTSDKSFREEYARLFEEKKGMLKETARRGGADIIEIVSKEGYDAALRKFFRMREKRMVR